MQYASGRTYFAIPMTSEGSSNVLTLCMVPIQYRLIVVALMRFSEAPGIRERPIPFAHAAMGIFASTGKRIHRCCRRPCD
jgi:hypothetical protein